ncbi:MASE2 domain-containing protein [Pseudomonas typographi]|uniref:Diguanylate cyclase n=1 Tax=Pseudomonas typographi TaxID=2715964 RepID=A0ABR7YY62_9PSED|nr:MASE2 domain-containing protein [Pseudomonas typographi]MBD1550380.1 diguanylate cyclase [Pseudomonas typographi]MBD1588875.1 diguanylate cyclase [Pseudomonas typographi]MBD1598153.1 diguanylate cyclase [Pseudomonas typographi]
MLTSRQAGISFAKRIIGPRALGCALSFIYIAVVAHEQGVPTWVWGWMLLNGFAWPWLAHTLSQRAVKPYRAELRNFLLDSVFAGGWIVVMQFNLLPSALLLSMVTMNNVAAGGLGFMLRGLLANATGVLVMGALVGLQVHWQTSANVVIASVPMLVIYPFSVGWTSYILAVRLFEQRKAFDIINSYDENTRLHSFNRWMGELAADYQRCRRSNGHSTLAVIYIDNLASLHRRHGYWVAQAVTGRLGHIILAEARNLDVIGSNSADGFFVLFPTQRERAAAQCLARISEQFGHFGSTAAELPSLSISMGVAEYNYQQHDERDWFDAAQQALEMARQQRMALAKAG